MKRKRYMTQISAVDFADHNMADKKHSFDKFDRCYDMFDEHWSSRYHYLLFSVLISNGNDVNVHLLQLEVALSGGIFILLFIIASFVFTMPLIYIEIFLGKYTKLTNCQIYRMATIFFGFSLAIFLVNVAYQVVRMPDDTMVLVSAIKTFLNFNASNSCLNEKKGCYNYLIDGPINETCTKVFMGMECERKGLIRFPKLYMHWKMYLDTDDRFYPYFQLIAGLALTWGIVSYISMKELDTLGSVINAAFIFQFVIMTIVFILGLVYLQSTDCLKILLNVDYKLLTTHNILNAVWYVIGHFGFVIPYGYMTTYAYANFNNNFGFECFIITFFHLFLTLYYITIYHIAAGVIAGNMAVDVSNLIVPEGGMFLIVIPEFFEHLELPNTFLFVYYGSIWFLGTVKNALCLHMLILNWYDYYPKTKYFSSYVTVIVCTLLCVLSIPTCLKKFNMTIIPLLTSICLRILVELCITVMSTMVCYVYGVSRLCEDIEFITGRRPIKYWRVMWYITPLFGWMSVLLSEKDIISFTNVLSFVKNSKKKYIAMSYIIFLTIVFISTVLKIIPHLNTPNLCLKLIKPQFYWGPSDRNTRIVRKHYNTTKYIRSETIFIPKIHEITSTNMDLLDFLTEESFKEYLD